MIYIKTVKQIVENIIEHNDMTFHRALGNNTEVLPDDWIRVYRGGDCIIDELIYSCDYKDVKNIPEEILNMSVNMYNTWLIGGTLSCDCIILNDKYKSEYLNSEKARLFV